MAGSRGSSVVGRTPQHALYVPASVHLMHAAVRITSCLNATAEAPRMAASQVVSHSRATHSAVRSKAQSIRGPASPLHSPVPQAPINTHFSMLSVLTAAPPQHSPPPPPAPPLPPPPPPPPPQSLMQLSVSSILNHSSTGPICDGLGQQSVRSIIQLRPKPTALETSIAEALAYESTPEEIRSWGVAAALCLQQQAAPTSSAGGLMGWGSRLGMGGSAGGRKNSAGSAGSSVGGSVSRSGVSGGGLKALPSVLEGRGGEGGGQVCQPGTDGVVVTFVITRPVGAEGPLGTGTVKAEEEDSRGTQGVKMGGADNMEVDKKLEGLSGSGRGMVVCGPHAVLRVTPAPPPSHQARRWAARHHALTQLEVRVGGVVCG